MKYIKLFATEAEKNAYTPTDNMLSYTESVDNVCITELQD